jgi:hypothetical protein
VTERPSRPWNPGRRALDHDAVGVNQEPRLRSTAPRSDASGPTRSTRATASRRASWALVGLLALLGLVGLAGLAGLSVVV